MNETAGIIILIINLIILIGVGWWVLTINSSLKNSPLTENNSQSNNNFNELILINPHEETGIITINRKKTTLYKGKNKLLLPKSLDSINIQWKIGNSPSHQKTVNVMNKNSYVILKEDLFRTLDWSAKTPIVKIFYPYLYHNHKNFQNKQYDETFELNVNTVVNSSVNINKNYILNAYKGLLLTLNYSNTFSNNKNIKGYINKPGEPIYVFKNIKFDGSIIPQITQDIFTITINYISDKEYFYIYTSPNTSLTNSEKYTLFPGINYFSKNSNNKWILIVDSKENPKRKWLPAGNYII